MSNQSASRPLLVLVDGHAVAYRAFFSLKVDVFHTADGEPTNATYGFARRILDILAEHPTYFAVSFDRGLSGRETLYTEYKGTREKMPDDLIIQMQRIEEMVRAFNIPVLALEGYEADDIIGTVTQQAEALGCAVRIVTGDGDLLQLLSAHTSVQLPQRGDDDRIYQVEDFGEKYPALQPHQLTDLKGLMGDNSDNIPGVNGIGEKGALTLIQAYGSVENLYAHLNELKGAQKQKLEDGRAMAFLSKHLATIRRDVPIQLDLQACLAHDFDPAVVNELFRKLEFRSLIGRLRKLKPEAVQPDLFDETLPKEAETLVVEPHTFSAVTTQNELAALVVALESASLICLDTETTGTSATSSNLVGISLAVNDKHGYYIPLGHISPNAPEGTLEGVLPAGFDAPVAPLQGDLFSDHSPHQLSVREVIAAIRPALTNPQIAKLGHNIKYDLIILRRYGIDVQPVLHDTILTEWVRDPESRNLGLKSLAWVRLNMAMKDITDLIGTGAKQITMARVPIEDAASYAAADVVAPMRLLPVLSADVKQHKAEKLLEELEIPLVPIIADIEMQGVLLDVPYLKVLAVELSQRLENIEQKIYHISGYGKFNINSLNQLSEVLFGKLGLSTVGMKKTKTGNFSLSVDVLEDMRDQHPVIPMIMEYRSLSKLKSTYVEALPALINPYSGRVHTSYNQTGTSTGRFSSSDPNLQNIPIRTDEGRRIRKAFIAPPGHVLLSADYSQVELRILAHYSGDEALLEAFRAGQDIHASTAAAVYGVSIDKVSFEQRSFAKSVNFGLMYGMGAFRLARDSGLTLAQAESFIRDYFAYFPGVKAYLDNSRRSAAELGYVETLFGRRRYFPALQEKEKTSAVLRQRAEREAINMPIQGTAADILKRAMINLHQALRQKNLRARMILQVHDELVLEVPETELPTVAPLVVEVMENAYELKAPLRAEANVGPNWHDMTLYRI